MWHLMRSNPRDRASVLSTGACISPLCDCDCACLCRMSKPSFCVALCTPLRVEFFAFKLFWKCARAAPGSMLFNAAVGHVPAASLMLCQVRVAVCVTAHKCSAAEPSCHSIPICNISISQATRRQLTTLGRLAASISARKTNVGARHGTTSKKKGTGQGVTGMKWG